MTNFIKILFLVILPFIAIACGNKNKKNSSNSPQSADVTNSGLDFMGSIVFQPTGEMSGQPSQLCYEYFSDNPSEFNHWLNNSTDPAVKPENFKSKVECPNKNNATYVCQVPVKSNGSMKTRETIFYFGSASFEATCNMIQKIASPT